MRLSTKVSLLLMSAVVITGMLIGVLTVEATTKSFDQYVFEVNEIQLSEWSEIYVEYYLQHDNSWSGVENIRKIQSIYDPFYYLNSQASVVLSDLDGVILYHPDQQYVGSLLAENIINRGYYLKLNGEPIGMLYPTEFFNPKFWLLEANFAQVVAKAAMKGTFFTSLFAILLGLAMSSYAVKPLQDLIRAASKMAKGDFNQDLPIYSSDEIGDLSRAFNSMAKDIEKGNKTKQQMFADISHELRTPLTVLASKLDITLEKNIPLEPVEIAALYDEVIRLNGLVSELQDISKLEAGHISLNRTMINFDQFFADYFVLLEAEAEDRHINLSIVTDEAAQYCYADPKRLKQIVLNLVNNAFRYTPEGGEVEIATSYQGDDFVFSVTDNGIGIAQEDVEFIFHRFYRADKSRDRETGGSGLGLAITKGFVEAHHGVITVESELGVGTRFEVRLPLEKKENLPIIC